MRVLPDDLVAKCLAMLPQCDLQERCVCKRWRELRLSSAFRRYRRDGVERVLVATSWDDPDGRFVWRRRSAAARRLGDPPSSGERTLQTMTRRLPMPSCCINPCKLSSS